MIENILKGITNRDIASFFWVVVVSLFVIVQSYRKKTNLISAFKNVLKAASNYRLIIIFLILFFNTVLSVYFLKYLGLWNLSQVKNKVIWLIFTGLVMISKAVTIKDYSTLMKQTIYGIFKITIFLEFFTNLYVFNLLLEVLLVFITTCLLIFSTYLEKSTEENKVRLYKFFSSAISLIVFLLLILTAYKVIHNPHNFLNHLSLLNLITPITLSVLSTPSILIIFIYTSYEERR